ncbi:LysM peptidoglycan-binding domain-containing protein [Bacillus sp. V5-8f]|uniref:LysM peptidoglycan-binding domain-containing protein n=1 Tax=Bacillus sp. V5-8f TaxID=2053044 RepID=UPI000C76BE3A|nr:LysM peptidoglycan-binding domain-containing protein [Bacillus sp. V5-8f]PLT34690.1 hypothetical protein CUU64_04585 [Bacillus sp. V5-8f]
MKRLLIFLATSFLGFIVYFDLTTGTLPSTAILTVEKTIDYPQHSAKTFMPYKEITIEPGDTLLSIVEREEGSLEVSIENVIADFQKLNNGLKPEDMLIGEKYKIPLYH